MSVQVKGRVRRGGRGQNDRKGGGVGCKELVMGQAP